MLIPRFPRRLEPRLLDQPAGAHPARVLKDAAGRLERERLSGLFHDPQFAHAARDFFGEKFGNKR